MPDSPMPQAQEEQSEGPAEMLAATGDALQKLVAMIGQDQSVPDGVKAAFAASLDAFTKGAEALTGGGAKEQEAPGAVSMEQGASGAKPMSMQRPQ